MLKKMNRKMLLFLFLLSAGLSCFSQTPRKWVHSVTHRYLGVREGLVQSQALLSFQDAYGYLWFSTFEGVSRFDGLHFETFSQAALGIGTSRVKYFGQYETAVYMIASHDIIFVYPDRTIENFPLPDSTLQISTIRQVEAVVVGNSLYIFNCQSPAQSDMTLFSLIRFDLKNKTFTHIADSLPCLRANVYRQKIYAVPHGELKTQQIKVYRIDNDRLQVVQNIQLEKKASHVFFGKTKRNEWFTLSLDNSESGSMYHLYQCYFENDALRWDYRMELFAVRTRWDSENIEQWDERRLVIANNGTSHPVFIVDTDNWSISEFSLNLLQVNHVMIDRDDNLWLSTEDGIYHCARAVFESYQLGLGRNDNLWGVIKDSHGNVWFSSYNYGFWRADNQGNFCEAETVYNRKDFSALNGYMGNCEDSRGRVFQTSDQGIAVFDPKLGNPNRLDIIRTGVSLSVYHDKENGNIYFGGDTGSNRTLEVMDETGDITSFTFGYRHIISICRDGNHRLRLGTFSGDAWLDEENRVVVFDTVQRPYTGIISMALDEKGILWKGTTHGLFAEDRQGNDRQLSDQPVNFVLHYRNQYIIWGHKDKLYLLDLQAYHRDATIHIRSFGYYDGFDLLECGQNGASIDPEGYVWVAGGDKAIRFLPEQIMKVPPLQPVTPFLAAIYNADKNSEWLLASTNNSMVFDYKDNYLRFDLLQASVSAPDKLVFRYRLNGYNDQWSTTRDRSLIFQNLPFGEFRFEVQSSVDDGQQWSDSLFAPPITIRPPFILTFPGLALIFIVLAAIGFLIYYYTRKNMLRKEAERRQIDRLKHRAVQAKFIPHFTGNVLNSINYLISKNPESARKYISKFSDFSNQTLRNTDRLWRSLKEELAYSQLYLELEKLRFEEKLVFTLFVAPEIDTQIMIPTMILQTFCENAIKHGLHPKPEGGKIEIRIYREADYIVIAVEDNGIGREKAQMQQTEGTKEGLKIVEQQLEIFNKNQPKDAFLNRVWR